MEVVLAVGEERASNPAVCASLTPNELTVKHGRLMSVQSVKREVHTAGLSMNDDSFQQGHGLFFFFFQQEWTFRGCYNNASKYTCPYNITFTAQNWPRVMWFMGCFVVLGWVSICFVSWISKSVCCSLQGIKFFRFCFVFFFFTRTTKMARFLSQFPSLNLGVLQGKCQLRSCCSDFFVLFFCRSYFRGYLRS